jgi:cytochrome c-type biogenesis protein CcmH/NrfG
MPRMGLAMLAAAALFATAAWAQGNNDSMLLELGANQLSDAQRQATQENIDRATRALQANDYATARRYAQSVTRADPKRVEAWLLLGAAQQGLQDWKKARITYSTAVRLWPNNPEARAGLGVALARTGDPKASVHLAWLTEKAAACGGCAQYVKYKSEVESALAAAPPKGS